jgi:hypothetical protein
VRIVRPASRREPEPAQCVQVEASHSDDPNDPADKPTITLKGFANSVAYRRGDLLVKVESPAAGLPEVVRYRLVDDAESDDPALKALQRSADDGATYETVAKNITNVEFRYLLDGGIQENTIPGDHHRRHGRHPHRPGELLRSQDTAADQYRQSPQPLGQTLCQGFLENCRMSAERPWCWF